MLKGRMALWWTGNPHDTPGMVDQLRDYAAIEAASHIAREGVMSGDIRTLGRGVAASHAVQLAEGMKPLPEATGSLGRKYSGGGFGGYALYLFESQDARNAFVKGNNAAREIEPYSNWE